MYFVDDIHWSPKGAKIIANVLRGSITRKKS